MIMTEEEEKEFPQKENTYGETPLFTISRQWQGNHRRGEYFALSRSSSKTGRKFARRFQEFFPDGATRRDVKKKDLRTALPFFNSQSFSAERI